MSCNFYKKIGFIGAGCYGTAIAQSLSSRVDYISLITDSAEIMNNINQKHVNEVLGDTVLSDTLSCFMKDYSAIKDAELIFITVPVGAVAKVCNLIKENSIKVPVILCSKGLDTENACLISEMVTNIIDNEFLVFSGPSFATEVVRGLPFGVNLASKNMKLAMDIACGLSSEICEIKPLDDYIGLQIAGAFKNILAIGCGMKRGTGLGNNFIAKFIVEGIEEMISLAKAMGGKKDTFFSLGGIGDIILTCTSEQSRNGRFGEYLANGGALSNWKGALAEGAFAAKGIPVFAKKYDVRFKVFDEIYKAIYQN
ncbi:MAG: NAD(P)H-dependent glycerol-3-phosphate dehydrogenase [Alphaproteobacteria bacterium]|nr:NAD(P)H-dependent glycerol-3-phosphate dehydrogenase [Alphaproteobacteria bacterium]